MTRSLSVWWDGALVGALRIDQHGDLGFAYDPSWLDDPARPPISQSLPKRAEAFNRRKPVPSSQGFFRKTHSGKPWRRTWAFPNATTFVYWKRWAAMLRGALTLWPEGETPPEMPALAETHPLTDDELADILDTLPKRPMLAGRDGLRLSLAGAQQKLPVVLVNGRIALPLPGQPTTHILKPPIARFSATTENEAFAMRLAVAVGLNVAPVEPRSIAGRPFLLVETLRPRERCPKATSAACTRRISARRWAFRPNTNTPAKAARGSRTVSISCGAPAPRPRRRSLHFSTPRYSTPSSETRMRTARISAFSMRRRP